jgi:hypothetical protein
MQSDTVTRDNWATLAEAAGLSLELLAVLTGKSYSAVYRYKTGSRPAPEAWLQKVQVIVADRAIRKETSA